MPIQTPKSKVQNAPAVVVVGGGIVGLSIAWRLAREGVRVTVLERGRCGAGASGAAAGMLAPLAEAKADGPFARLGLASLALYPEFVEGLCEATGRAAETPGPGLLRVALDEEQGRSLRGAAGWQEAAGLPIHQLTGDEARALEPALSERVVAAMYSPREKQFDPRVLVDVLAHACEARGVEVVEETEVIGFERSGGRVVAVQTRLRNVDADHVVVSGGAWTEEIGAWLGARLPVFPVKGQILALVARTGDAAAPAPRHSIYSHHGYLVPRHSDTLADAGHRRIIVGATAERAGFDTRPTAGGIAGLLQTACTLAPSLADAEFESVWAGLRPATPDGLPILGPLPGWENVHVAAGHFRNGILLAPVTAELIAASLLGGEPALPLEPFLPDRFASAE